MGLSPTPPSVAIGTDEHEPKEGQSPEPKNRRDGSASEGNPGRRRILIGFATPTTPSSGFDRVIGPYRLISLDPILRPGCRCSRDRRTIKGRHQRGSQPPRSVPMPALYRMPVFYLLLLCGSLVYTVGVGLRPREAPPVEVVPEYTPPPIRVADEKDDLPTDPILRTAGRLRRKVLVKDLAVVCRSDPNGGRAVGSPLDYFAIRYIYNEEPAGQPDRFQVGPMGGTPQGWVPASAVLEWDTRLMARPAAPGRPAAPWTIYRDESCLVNALAGRTLPEARRSLSGRRRGTGGGDRIAGRGPAARVPDPAVEVGGGSCDPRGRQPGQGSGRGADLPTDRRPTSALSLKVVYVAFAIDTTKVDEGQPIPGSPSAWRATSSRPLRSGSPTSGSGSPSSSIATTPLLRLQGPDRHRLHRRRRISRPP